MDSFSEMISVVAYLRVSTDEQAATGVSLSAQHERIFAYSKLYGLDITETISDDGYSASTLERPGLRRCLELLEIGGAEGVVVAKLDRLTRSLRDLIDLTDRYFRDGKYSLMSVAEQLDQRSAAGRLVMNILAAVAQWERETISERTRDALHWKKSQGFRVGSVPYGYCSREDGRLEIDPHEQDIIGRVTKLRGLGFSLQTICQSLKNDNLHPRLGADRNWYPKQIRSMLRSVR